MKTKVGILTAAISLSATLAAAWARADEGDHDRPSAHSAGDAHGMHDAETPDADMSGAKMRNVGETQLQQGAGLMGARALFLDHCAGCHGPRGHGTDTAPVDFAAPEALIRLTPEAIAAALGEPPHESAAALSGDARQALIGYLRSYLMLPAPATDTVLGRTIYARDCSVCHGDRGDAASWAKNSLSPAPADFTAHGLDQLSREEMIEAVTFGKDDSAMMGFATQLSREEIAATVDYIREAFMPETGTADHAGHHHHPRDQGPRGRGHADGEAAAYPGGLTGDPVWGEAFYNANCAECHGRSGDGQGPRAYFMVIKPENFLSRAARAELNRSALFKEIGEGVRGTVMPAWDKVLTPQQIADVAEYVYRAFIHPEEHGDAAAGPAERPAAAGSDAKKN